MNSCSLLVPCYNASNYLPRLWETVEAQTIPFDEIVVYDDGSTDNTAAVAKALGARVIGESECKGPAYARNRLAEAATSTWIHFHDADDIFHPHYLDNVKSKINDSVDVIICDADWIDEASWLIQQEYNVLIARRYRGQELEHEPLKSTLTNPVGVISTLCRKTKFLDINGFNEHYSCWEDGDFHVRLAAAAARFAVVEKVLVYSLRHDRGISSQPKHCNQCRLKLLGQYAKQFDTSLHKVIAEELEKTAHDMIASYDYENARLALQICKKMNADPPTSNSLAIRLLKELVSPLFALRIQSLVRKSPMMLQKLRL